MTAVLDSVHTADVRVAAMPNWRDSIGRPVARVRLEQEGRQSLVLSCGQMTVALFYCGTPLTWDMTADEVAGLVVRGVDRLGMDQVRRLDDTDRADGLSMVAGRISHEGYYRQARRRWAASEGGERQRSRAMLFAAGLFRVSRGEPFRRYLNR